MLRLLLCLCFAVLLSCDAVAQTDAESKLSRHAEFRDYAATHPGDSQRGGVLFDDLNGLGCVKCHPVDGTSRAVGPNLFAIGNKVDPSELMTSVLVPSKTVAIGYCTTIVLTESGEIAQGVLRVTDQWIELLDKDGKAIRVNVDDIEDQKSSDVSIMPTGLVEKLSAQNFADLIAYLSTLKQTEPTSRWPGVPNRIEQASSPVGLVPLFGDMTFEHPVWFGEVPSTEDREPSSIKKFVVLEQAGRAYYVESATPPTRKPLFDLTSSVRLGGATGLLGMAFHPQFHSNRRYFIKYQTIEAGAIQTVVEERSLDLADLESSQGTASKPRRLITIPATTQDHNGGCLEFGPDGYLYIGTGDSGPQHDPQGNGQDLGSLLGKILRIDVDHAAAPLASRIPKDNPFRSQTKAREEIWAYGNLDLVGLPA